MSCSLSAQFLFLLKAFFIFIQDTVNIIWVGGYPYNTLKMKLKWHACQAQSPKTVHLTAAVVFCVNSQRKYSLSSRKRREKCRKITLRSLL